MENENGFVKLALCESDSSKQSYRASDLAEIALMGGLEQYKNLPKKEFVQCGIDYIKQFPDKVKIALEDLYSYEEPPINVINEILVLAKAAEDLDLKLLERLFEKSWEQTRRSMLY